MPINSTAFSKRWVSLFGQTSYELVSPLIDSLLCDLPQLAPDKKIAHHIRYPKYLDMLKVLGKNKKIEQKNKIDNHDNTVRSIQRLQVSKPIQIRKVANLYLKWLPIFMKSFIKVRKDINTVYFQIPLLSRPLLVLDYVPEEQDLERVKFHIVGGILTRTKNTGWLEFRMVEPNKIIIASINDFIPALPWFIYILTQAPFHKFVMKKFAQYLSIASQEE